MRLLRAVFGSLSTIGVQMLPGDGSAGAAATPDPELRRRLALVAENTAHWAVLTDPQRYIVWANRSFLDAMGMTQQQAAGVHLLSLVAPQDNDPQLIANLSAQLDQGRSVKVEVMARRHDGQGVWLDVDYQPVRAADGSMDGYVILAADITEQVNQGLKLRALFNALPTGVVVQAQSGAIVDCNPAALEMSGLTRDILLQAQSLATLRPNVRDDLSEYAAAELPTSRTLRDGVGLRGESVGIVFPDGDVRWRMVNTEPLTDAQGRPAGVVTCSVDVTDQRAHQQLLAMAVDGAGLGTWQWDIATGRISGNERMQKVFGLAPGSVPMTVDAWNQLIHPDDLEPWLRSVTAHLSDPLLPHRMELRVRRADGHWIWLLFSGAVVTRSAGGAPQRMAGVCLDVNAQKELESQLRQSASTDVLTQLPNRAAMLDQISRCIARGTAQPGYHFAVLFLDFDRFKHVNDSLGHSVGDELLQQIATRLQDGLRPGDAFVRTSDFSQMAARIGGDEFVVLLDDIRGDLDAEIVAGRLLDLLSQTYVAQGNSINSSVSIGIVTTGQAAADAEGVLRDADIAMYEAKRAGRGRHVMFDPGMRKRARDDVLLENDLRQALDKGEMFVVYQPVVDLADGAWAGMEALVRWRHPQRGLVSPVEFIPLAESSGMIGQIGQFVLQAACAEFASLQSGQYVPPSVAVNLSRAQLRQPGLAAEVLDTLRASAMAPSQLILEVTESLAAQDMLVQATLQELRELGVMLALDDFGTGYSSLSCLHELPVNTVKIDRSFVSRAQTSDYHRVMIEATIRMAQTLGLATVAEGIETAQQAALMQALGCGKGQGYLYSKPLPADQLQAWINALPSVRPAA